MHLPALPSVLAECLKRPRCQRNVRCIPSHPLRIGIAMNQLPQSLTVSFFSRTNDQFPISQYDGCR